MAHMASSFQFNPDNPFEKTPQETKKSNRALRDYYEIGAARSLRELSERYRAWQLTSDNIQKPPTRSLATLVMWSTDHQWQERVAIAEKLDEEAVTRAREEALRLDAERWVQRRREVREADFEIAEKLRSVVNQALESAPQFTKTRRRFTRNEDGTEREIITIALDMTAITSAARASSQLGRLATDLATERVESDVAVGEDLEKLRERRWAEASTAMQSALDDDDES